MHANMKSSTNNAYQATLSDFADEVLVQCPQCDRCAIVRRGENDGTDKLPRVVCAACGFHKESSDRSMLLGAPCDPYFKLPLWLSAEVNGEVLWAYNRRHLALLRLFVKTKVRERNGLPMRNQSVASRLPRWITSAKNRTLVIKVIDKMSDR